MLSRHSISDTRLQHELSTPIKRQIAHSAAWFIRLRWGATAGVAAIGVFAPMLAYPPGWRWLIAVAVLLGLANIAFYYLHLQLAAADVDGNRLRRFNLTQIAFDWLALLLLIQLTGGISSPCIFFFFFHLVIAAILLPVTMVYGLAFTASILLYSVTILEPTPGMSQSSEIVIGFALSAFSLVLVTNYVSNLIRQRMHQLARTKIDLEDTNARLEAMLRVIRLVGEHKALDDLLAQAVEQAAQLWEIRAGFILLINRSRNTPFFAAAYRLETPFPTAIELLSLPAIQQTLEEKSSLILDDIRIFPDYSKQPMLHWLSSLGKRSLLLVPLRVGGEFFGAMGLTSRYVARFSRDDAEYFGLFSDLLAIDIQNLQIQTQQQQHDQARTWFYRRASHDLRAPLGVVRTMLETIDDAYLNDTRQVSSLLKKADQRLEEMQGLVDELLLLAKDRAIELDFPVEPIDLKDVLFAGVEAFRPEAEKHHVKLSLNLPDLPIPVKATQDGLRRIFANLLSNAVKYNREFGEVAINAEFCDHTVIVSISDTGIGLTEEVIPHIFKEFYRAPNAKSHTDRGTGLGLAIVKQLVESYGGNIAVKRNESHGTTFSVSFPLFT